LPPVSRPQRKNASQLHLQGVPFSAAVGGFTPSPIQRPELASFSQHR
jgi:hypothetical protein